jgi:NAD(P)-dependent dehydrogenase (short-subunit alcohol dehydrogenase family)
MSKVWIITGSGSGLGRAIAEAGLEAGDQVVATARNTDQLTDLVARYGARVLAFQLDVTIDEEGRAAVQAAVETFGRLDVLVNNAGYGDARPFEQVPSAEFRKLVETCLFGVVNLTRCPSSDAPAAQRATSSRSRLWADAQHFRGTRPTSPRNGPWAASLRIWRSRLRLSASR